MQRGITRNLPQFGQQLAQVFLAGMTLGMVCTVAPTLAAEIRLAKPISRLL